jgi:chromosome segregation ATPase
VDDEIARLKELQKQRETLKKTLEQLSAEIKQAAGLPDLIEELTDEKATAEKSLTGLDQQETQISDKIKTAVDEWRKKRNELVAPKVENMITVAKQIDKLTKEIDYLKAYEDDITAQYLIDPNCCQKSA